jgi:hypothetical protein
MTRPVSSRAAGSEFNDFLYAPISEESDGMSLSVLSALARSNVDPWDEAARLARMPGDAARRTLAALIVALPNGYSTRLDCEALAARLIDLLPHVATGGSPAATSVPASVPPNRVMATSMLLYLVLMTFFLAAHWLLAAHQQPAAPATTPRSATTGEPARPAAPSPAAGSIQRD